MVSNTIYWEIFLLSQSIGVSQKAFFSRHIFIVKKIYINEWLQKNNPLLYSVLEKKKKTIDGQYKWLYAAGLYSC